MLAGLKSLLAELPQCNRNLIEWILVHMGHVIKHEKQNKMSLQNVSIVLSPTMQISHRVLYVLFKYSDQLFGHVKLKKYVPPISELGGLSALPESPREIEEEMKKQESLLEDLHKEISQGVASKATEEQIWEQQRIVTQLKRNLRVARASQRDAVDEATAAQAKLEQEEELNFALQTPLTATPVAEKVTRNEEPGSGTTPTKEMSSPDDKEESVGHKVIVQIHQTTEHPEKIGHVTVINLEKAESTEENMAEAACHDDTETSIENSLGKEKLASVDDIKDKDNSLVGPPPVNQTSPISSDQTSLSLSQPKPSSASQLVRTDILPSALKNETQRGTFDKPVQYENIDVKVKKVDFQPDQANASANEPHVQGDNKETGTVGSRQPPPPPTASAGIPLLPPPPSSTKPSSRGLLKPTLVPHPESRMKSKSLPRGLPSDPQSYNNSSSSVVQTKRQTSEPDQVTIVKINSVFYVFLCIN